MVKKSEAKAEKRHSCHTPGVIAPYHCSFSINLTTIHLKDVINVVHPPE